MSREQHSSSSRSRSTSSGSSRRSVELRVGQKWRLGKKIGSGSFGDIYLGTSAKPKHYSTITRSCSIFRSVCGVNPIVL